MPTRLFRSGWSVAAAIACGPLLAGGVADAQIGQTDRRAIDAFEAVLGTAAAWEPAEGWVFRWRQEVLPGAILDEIERREAALRDRPDHPDHAFLRVLREQAERGTQTTEYEVWWSAPGSLRFNSTYGPDAAMPYVDVVAASGNVFTMTPGAIAIVDPAAPPTNMAFAENAEADVLKALRDFFVGGLGASRYRGLSPMEASYDGSTLVGVLGSPEGETPPRRCTIHFDGPDGPLPVVRHAILRVEGDGPPSESQIRYLGRVQSGIPGQTVASSVEKVNARGQVDARWTWLGARRIEPDEFARVTKVPAIDSADAVRGPVTFTRIMDYRKGVIRSSDPATGVLTTLPMPGVARATQANGWLTIAGWTSAGVLIAALVGFRLWRSRRSAST